MGKRRKKAGEGPGGGPPGRGRSGGPEPGPSPAARKGRGGKRKGPGRRPGKNYTPEERRRLLEAWERSGMAVAAFARTVGVAPQTLGSWKRRYEKEGPRGLEPRRLGRPQGSGKGSRLPAAVREAVAATKRRFPTFGVRKVRDFLFRFRGLSVTPHGVKKALEEDPPAAPETNKPRRRKPRKRRAVRRFERSRPGDLWQTDITSMLLRRHHRRLYLVVYLDDFSRYVVSWALAPQAKAELVTGTLLDGIQRFGKPREVLSDQGPQYYSWRGKSRFRKLLQKEGIRHVVARSHHPQTLGKCERLWKTVGEELWERIQPDTLEEARERMGHFFAFYNHFRPHQGIGGLVPADRFFGKEEEVRRALEARLHENELQLALGERPRKTVFLMGQVGDRSVSLHGERGRLVLRTDEGQEEAVCLEELGLERKEAGDGDQGQGGAGGHGGGGGGAEAGAEADAAPPSHPSTPAGGVGAGAVEGGHGAGAAPGPRGGAGDPGLVAGGAHEGGGAGAAGGEAAAAVADEPDGALGDGGGAAETAEEQGDAASRDTGAGEPGGAQAEGPPSGAGASAGEGAGGSPPAAPVVEEPWGDGNALPPRCEGGSQNCSAPASRSRSEGSSQGSTA